jgi:hypothetical protein
MIDSLGLVPDIRRYRQHQRLDLILPLILQPHITPTPISTRTTKPHCIIHLPFGRVPCRSSQSAANPFIGIQHLCIRYSPTHLLFLDVDIHSPSLQPTSRPTGGQRTVSSSSGGANYNISLSPQAPVVSPSIQPLSPQPTATSTSTSSWASLQPSQPSRSAAPSFSSNISSFQPLQASNPIAPPQQYIRPQQSQPQAQTPVAPAPAPAPMRPPPGFTSGLMTPSVAPKPAWNHSQSGKVDWGDFDPLK